MKNAIYYADRINTLTTQSASSIIEIGCSFLEAKQELTETEYKRFLLQTKYAEGSASIRKWNKIGEAALRLQVIADRLPIQWTTIYAVACLSGQKFDELIQSPILCQSMTAKEMSDFFSASLSSKTKPKKINFTLTFDPNIDPQELLLQMNELQMNTSRFGFKVDLSNDAIKLIEFAKKQQQFKQAA